MFDLSSPLFPPEAKDEFEAFASLVEEYHFEAAIPASGGSWSSETVGAIF